MVEHHAGHLVLKWLIEQDSKMKESDREGENCSKSSLLVFVVFMKYYLQLYIDIDIGRR